MKNIVLILFYSLQEVKDEVEEFSELNDVDWSAFPISEEFGAWIPIALVFIIFLGLDFWLKQLKEAK